jgi:hypothetical protein
MRRDKPHTLPKQRRAMSTQDFQTLQRYAMKMLSDLGTDKTLLTSSDFITLVDQQAHPPRVV